MKAKKYKIDEELMQLPSWDVYGGVTKSYRRAAGVKQPDCTAETPCLRTGGYSFVGTQDAEYEFLSFTVSGNMSVIVQNIRRGFDARLIGEAPTMLRLIKRIADGAASLGEITESAKEIMDAMRVPVRVPGYHDYTKTDLADRDYETEW